MLTQYTVFFILVILWLTVYDGSPHPSVQTSSSQELGLYGFDCSLPGISTKAINLIEVESCKIPEPDVLPDHQYVQVIQAEHSKIIKAYSCRVFESYSIFRCGMHSHQMLVDGPFYNVPKEISKEMCSEMFQYGSLQLTVDAKITGIKVNETYRYTTTEGGAIYKDGGCESSTIISMGVEYKYSFKRVSYEILIKDYSAKVDVEDNVIHLADGLVCKHNTGSCYDTLVGRTYWTPYVTDCNSLIPYLLYEGMSDITRVNRTPSMIRVNEGDFLFLSLLPKTIRLCGRSVHTTDYQDIVVLIVEVYNPKLQISRLDRTMVNPILYSNAKVSYLQYKLIDDMNAIFKDVYFKMCQIERKVLENTLNIIRMSHQHTVQISSIGGRGTFINVQGEVAYLTYCPVVKVELREEDKCYEGIPVTVNQTQRFLLPVSRLLVSHVPETPCSTIAPTMFKIGNKWVAQTPKFIPYSDPDLLHPEYNEINTVQYITGFSSGGIYSEKDIKQFYDNLAFPSSRDAILTDVTKSVIFNTHMETNLLEHMSPDSWKAAAKNHFINFWGYFINFGEVISGLLGVYFIYLLICRTVGVLFRTFALYKTGKAGWRIIYGLSSTATTMLLTKIHKGSWKNEVNDQSTTDKASKKLQSKRKKSKDATLTGQPGLPEEVFMIEEDEDPIATSHL